MSEQKKAEIALAHQACALCLDLEKAFQDNYSLHTKLDQEDKLSSDKKLVRTNYTAALKTRLEALCNTVAASMSQQNEQLECIDKLCHSFLYNHDEAIIELKTKVVASKTLHISHVEALQNTVLLHKASNWKRCGL